MIIAGTDSSGGAGLTRDVAVASDLGFDVLPVVTAVTVQTDHALLNIHSVPSDIIRDQIVAAIDSGSVSAIKIGMLGTGQAVDVVVDALARSEVPIVLDPVLKSTSGGALMIGLPLAPLFNIASLVTPNLEEAAVLTGSDTATEFDQISAQAAALRRMGAKAVLIKGGHSRDTTCRDHLFESQGHQVFAGPRLNARKRGTGCALSTAIACHLGAGLALGGATGTSVRYVRDWIGLNGGEPSNVVRQN